MDAKKFANLSLRDFENSATRDEIYDALKKRDQLQADLALSQRALDLMAEALNDTHLTTDQNNAKAKQNTINWYTAQAAAEGKDGDY